ncbi:MAG TPA: 16S rRNA (cytosine(967)-C(5))-methyltransferase RsmB [Syntrophomonadaceae bacterium]|nr:16S rRNA (cytosine(967)-C(5))-methyltransferase RsmB [Syntrophomonadaceae bacterium]
MPRPKDSGSALLRQQAAELVYEVMEKSAYTNLLLEKRMRKSKMISADRRLLTEIVNGTVRMVKHLDWVLNRFLKGDVTAQNPWLRTILRISSYQILFMNRVPDYAVVNDAVEIAGRKCGPGLSRVANGVLRNLLRQQASLSFPEEESEYLAVCWSHPSWIVELLQVHYGAEACRQILTFNNQAPPLVLRCNNLLTSAGELLEELQTEGVICCISPLIPSNLRVVRAEVSLVETKAFQSGHFYIQNEASTLAAAILQPQKGQLVYDLCSGVGGKSTHLAEIMNNIGEVRSFDLFEQKLALLEANCRRMGVKIVKTRPADITELKPDLDPGQAVLLDAPCSGLGVLARRADARWRKKPQDLEVLQALQASMLEQAASLVGADGRLLYSTCTINPGENQEVIEAFLRQHPEYVLEGFEASLSSWHLTPDDEEAARQGMLCLLPGKYDSDGMFYALMRKKDRVV